MDMEKNIREAVIKYSDTLYKVCIVISCNEQPVFIKNALKSFGCPIIIV